MLIDKGISHPSFYKKTFLIFMVLLMFTYVNVTTYQRAQAATGIFNLPGYADEMFKGVFVATTTAAVAAGAAGQTMLDNLELIKDAAGAAWTEYSPEMKEAFKTALSASGDAIVLSGDYITKFLDKLKPNFQNTFNDTISTISYDDTDFVYFKFNYPYKFNFSKNPITSSDGSVSEMLAARGSCTDTSCNLNLVYSAYFNTVYYGTVTDPILVAKLRPLITSLNNKTASTNTIVSLYQILGWNFVIFNGSNVVSKETDAIYNQLDRWMRDHGIPLLKDAGVVLPSAEPWVKNTDGTRIKLNVNQQTGELTLDGKTLSVDQTGQLTLDGVNLGNLEWELPKTKVITDAAGATVAVTLVDGYWINTLTGEVVRVATSSEIAELTGITPKEPPPKEPTKETNGFKDIVPVALLLALLDFVRAVLYYLMRLFNYLLTLPMIPQIEVPYESFNWFRNAEFLGIKPYQYALNFAAFALSFVIFKFVKKVI